MSSKNPPPPPKVQWAILNGDKEKLRVYGQLGGQRSAETRRWRKEFMARRRLNLQLTGSRSMRQQANEHIVPID